MIRSGEVLQDFHLTSLMLGLLASILICAPALGQPAPNFGTEAVFSQPGHTPHVVEKMHGGAFTIHLPEPPVLIQEADAKTRGYFLAYPLEVTPGEESDVRVWFDKNAKTFKLTATTEPDLNELWKNEDNNNRAITFWMEATRCEQESNDLIAKRFCEESLRLLEKEHDANLRRHIVYFYVDHVLKKLGKTEQAQKIETDFNFQRDYRQQQIKKQIEEMNRKMSEDNLRRKEELHKKMAEENKRRMEAQKSPIP